jgi:hypothetical protein
MATQSFNEYLEELMDLKKSATIRFKDVDGAVAIIKAHIIDIKTQAGREMIETDAGMHIGLDQLLQVNDRIPDNYC